MIVTKLQVQLLCNRHVLIHLDMEQYGYCMAILNPWCPMFHQLILSYVSWYTMGKPWCSMETPWCSMVQRVTSMVFHGYLWRPMESPSDIMEIFVKELLNTHKKTVMQHNKTLASVNCIMLGIITHKNYAKCTSVLLQQLHNVFVPCINLTCVGGFKRARTLS